METAAISIFHPQSQPWVFFFFFQFPRTAKKGFLGGFIFVLVFEVIKATNNLIIKFNNENYGESEERKQSSVNYKQMFP